MADELDTSIDLATGRPIDQINRPGIKAAILKWITGVAVVAVLTVMILPFVIERPRSRRLPISHLNLRQIGMALHNYHGVYASLPPAYTVDPDGKPLHSWRTLILPYLERSDLKELYSSIDLSKPWNDRRNAEAYDTEISVSLSSCELCGELHDLFGVCDARGLLSTEERSPVFRGD